MKKLKIHTLILLLISFMTVISCSNDDDSQQTEKDEIENPDDKDEGEG